MSVAVEVEQLAERVGEYGPAAFVVTVGEGASAHVVSAPVAVEGELLVVTVGRTTAANVERQPTATVLWAGRPGDDYCLIVDGTASVRAGGGVVVEPTRAVLHRLAGAASELPSCVTVLDRRPA